MAYIPHTEAEIQAMLATIGVKSLSDLFTAIPNELRVKPGSMNLPSSQTEMEILKTFKDLAKLNKSVVDYPSFLGAGIYDHFIPAAVDALSSRGEFLSAYTPYQAEASQGTLQAIFEYQTAIARICGMEVSNASLYDGSTALAEALLMAIHTLDRKKVILSATIHPEYIEVIRTYLEAFDVEIVVIPHHQFETDYQALNHAIDDRTAAVAVSYPNFFGIIEKWDTWAKKVHDHQAINIATVYPIALGYLKSPAQLGADIIVGEGQPLGNSISFGGPHFGFLATDNRFIRKMPGRIVGQTVDEKGNPGFCLTFQTREQHIRREKATSNICTNQSLCALRAIIFLSLIGETGFKEMAHQNYQKAHYLQSEMGKIGLQTVSKSPFFNEFVVQYPHSIEHANQALENAGYIGGLDLGRFGYKDHWMWAVTEKRTKEELDTIVSVLKGIR